MLFIGVSGWLQKAPFLPGDVGSMYLVFPLQTVVCGGLLAWFWPQYGMALPRKAWAAILIGLAVFAIWISPQAVFHQPPRLTGFNPTLFAGLPRIYWAELVMRFLRLVVVVPLLEEVFWRGFLLRAFINEDFDTVLFGAYAFRANALVAIGFMLEHSFHDWPAGLIAGVLYNLTAFYSKSLSSCVLAHALTNALLGIFIMHTGQWGFW